MNEVLPATTQEKPKQGRVRRVFFWILATPILGFVSLIMLGLVVGPIGLKVLAVLLTGWIGFLSRTVPRITVNWDLLGMGLLCTSLILLGGQWVLQWIVNSIALARGWNWRWRWRWTISAVLGVTLLFLVGMAVGGAVHQIGWLGSQPGPWYERKGEDSLDMRVLDSELQQAMLEADGDIERVRAFLNDPEQSYSGRQRGEPPSTQRFHVLLIVSDTKKAEGAILFHRDVKKRERGRVNYRFHDENDYVPAVKLPELIQKHHGHLVAL